jgi:hypothetical protein
VPIRGIFRRNRTRKGEPHGEQGTKAVKPGSQKAEAEKESGRKAVGGQGASAKNLKIAAARRTASGDVGAC